MSEAIYKDMKILAAEAGKKDATGTMYRIQNGTEAEYMIKVFDNKIVNGKVYVPKVGDEIRVGKNSKGFYWFQGMTKDEVAKDDYWAAKLDFDVNTLHPAMSLQKYIEIAASQLTATDNPDQLEVNVQHVWDAGVFLYQKALEFNEN